MATHYQTGRGTLCSLDNDASIRTATRDHSTVTCTYCLELMRLNTYRTDWAQRRAPLTHAGIVFATGAL